MTVQEMREALIEAGYVGSIGMVGWKNWYTWVAPDGTEIEVHKEESIEYKKIATIQAYAYLLLDTPGEIG